MQEDLVSVVIPTYDRADFITKTLDSVWEQTYRPIELIVVDDGSTDNTKEAIEEWAKNHVDNAFTLKYFYQKNAGAPTARNKGIEKATGRYLQFLDSDDLLMPEKLALQIKKLKQEKTPICICDYIHMDHKGNVIRIASNNRTIEQIITDYIYMHTSFAVIDKTHFKENALKWNSKLKKLQDRDFYLKLFFIISDFSYVDKPLFKWVRHKGDRIFDSTPHTKKLYWDSLKSLLIFHIKYWKSIQFEKYTSIIYLYLKLFRKAVGLGRFIPEFFKSKVKSLIG